MVLNLTAINRDIGPLIRHYSWRDVIICALGVGSGFGEFPFVYKKTSRSFPPFPFCGYPDAQYHDLLQPDLPLFRLPAVVDPEPLIRVFSYDLFHDFCETLSILPEIRFVVPRSGNFDQGFQD